MGHGLGGGPRVIMSGGGHGFRGRFYRRGWQIVGLLFIPFSGLWIGIEGEEKEKKAVFFGFMV